MSGDGCDGDDCGKEMVLMVMIAVSVDGDDCGEEMVSMVMTVVRR